MNIFGKKKSKTNVNSSSTVSSASSATVEQDSTVAVVYGRLPGKYATPWGGMGFFVKFVSLLTTLAFVANVIFLFIAYTALMKYNMSIVGIDEKGIPQLLTRTNRTINIEQFVSSFTQLLYGYNPINIDRNFKAIQIYLTPDAATKFRQTYDENFRRQVQDNNINQMLNVSHPEIQKTRTGYTVKVKIEATRSSNQQAPTTKNATVVYKILCGTANINNDWGLYVDEIKETTTN
mgnify:CR=1 FL=1